MLVRLRIRVKRGPASTFTPAAQRRLKARRTKKHDDEDRREEDDQHHVRSLQHRGAVPAGTPVLDPEP